MQSLNGCELFYKEKKLSPKVSFHSVAIVLMNCCVIHCPKQFFLAANYRFCCLNLLTVYFYQDH